LVTSPNTGILKAPIGLRPAKRHAARLWIRLILISTSFPTARAALIKVSS
jgi:hypothetical protein